jgi:oxygen-independent coproporphyrinogen-3 oxidase
MGLRLGEGVDLAGVAARFGLSEREVCDATKLAFYKTQGLVWRAGSRMGLTDAGFPLLDALLGELVPAALLAA